MPTSKKAIAKGAGIRILIAGAVVTAVILYSEATKASNPKRLTPSRPPRPPEPVPPPMPAPSPPVSDPSEPESGPEIKPEVNSVIVRVGDSLYMDMDELSGRTIYAELPDIGHPEGPHVFPYRMTATPMNAPDTIMSAGQWGRSGGRLYVELQPIGNGQVWFGWIRDADGAVTKTTSLFFENVR